MSRLWSSASADEIGWRALSAWMSGDADSISEFKSILRSRATDARYLYWRLLIDLLTGDRASSSCIEAQAQTLLGVADRLVRCRERRKRLVLAVAGQRWRSPALHGPEELVCQQLRAGAKRVPASYPPGVKFLASWRNRMPMVDGLPALLAVLEDADDELRVLTGGCQWLVERSGAERCAIVSADGGMLLAGEGWRTSDLAGEISGILRGPDRDVRHGNDGKAPSFGVSIRSLGVTIGFVVVRGRTTDRHALQQSALVLATLVAPATRSRLDAVAAAARARLNIPEIVGESPLMASVRDAIARAATAPFPILIEGESGTGKELVARALHRLGPRRDKRLNAVNCAALTDELVEAELFGHVRGAFTGAVGPRVGLFEESHGGTLFLDEVTELSPRAQAKLLRVLQEGEIRRVGENQARSVDVRIIAACNVPLADAVAAGRFREDLRYRLAVVRISVPPLRERIEDIPTLAMAFWRRAALEAGTRAAIGPDALARLTRHSWPGNVRELQNVIAGLVVLAPLRGRASARHVEQVLSHATPIADTPGVQLEAARRTFERRVIMSALSRHAGRRHAAAAELGLTRQGLTKALRRLGLTADENAAGVA
jgi:DNA-binding NtrC family response regulator